jgi:exosortase family protein XrtF
MASVSYQEFKPTLFFLGKFLGCYIVVNLLYGIYVTSFLPGPDPATRWVSEQTAFVLTSCGYKVETSDHPLKPTTLLKYESRPVLSVYEGCNGINVMVIFLAFILAFGPIGKKMMWFIPAGILIIHLINLLRVGVLFFVAEYRPDAMYILHKYVLTSMLYVVAFLLWIRWVRLSLKKS